MKRKFSVGRRNVDTPGRSRNSRVKRTRAMIRLPLRLVLSLIHWKDIGGKPTMGEMVNFSNLMTPGQCSSIGSEFHTHLFEVCRPELIKQLPEIAAVPLPKRGRLDRFYRKMVARFGENVIVKGKRARQLYFQPLNQFLANDN